MKFEKRLHRLVRCDGTWYVHFLAQSIMRESMQALQYVEQQSDIVLDILIAHDAELWKAWDGTPRAKGVTRGAMLPDDPHPRAGVGRCIYGIAGPRRLPDRGRCDELEPHCGAGQVQSPRLDADLACLAGGAEGVR